MSAVSWINGHTKILAPNPGNLSVLPYNGKVFADVIRLRFWHEEIIQVGLTSSHTCTYRDRPEDFIHRGEGDVKIEAQIGVMLSHTKQCQQSQEVRKVRETDRILLWMYPCPQNYSRFTWALPSTVWETSHLSIGFELVLSTILLPSFLLESPFPSLNGWD